MEKDTFVNTAKQIFSSTKEDLAQFRYNATLKLLREETLRFLLNRRNEDEYFNLDPYTRNTQFDMLITTLRDDLHSASWKTELSFNDTGLFIFKDEKPKTCW